MQKKFEDKNLRRKEKKIEVVDKEIQRACKKKKVIQVAHLLKNFHQYIYTCIYVFCCPFKSV